MNVSTERDQSFSRYISFTFVNMAINKTLFQQVVGQTSPFPLQLKVARAKGSYFYTEDDTAYYDFTSGIAVSNLGHGYLPIIKAIQQQAETHLHTMVYGEFIEAPQVRYASLLTSKLPEQLNCLYYCTSGSEAVEASLKLAKRATQRTEICYFKGSYHGSTHGAMSVMGSEKYRQAYRPLLPDTKMLPYNCEKSLQQITTKTACVIVEVVQAASGVTIARQAWLTKLRERCNETGALLIFDEIQTGFGRTGSLFAFEQYQVVPDMLLIAKAMGGGIPIGGLVANREILNLFTHQPMLGHINTFGGNAIACVAAEALLKGLTPQLTAEVNKKADYIVQRLESHQHIEKITYKGLLIALHFKQKENALKLMQLALDEQLVVIGFLLNDATIRLAPPLTSTYNEIEDAVNRLILAMNRL